MDQNFKDTELENYFVELKDIFSKTPLPELRTRLKAIEEKYFETFPVSNPMTGKTAEEMRPLFKQLDILIQASHQLQHNHFNPNLSQE